MGWEMVLTSLWMAAVVPLTFRDVVQRTKNEKRRARKVSEGVWFSFLYCSAHALFLLSVVGLSNDNTYVDVVRKASVLSNEEANALVRATEEYAESIGGWENQRHAQYATTDVAVQGMDNAQEIAAMVEDRVFPVLRENFDVKSEMWLEDLFVIKYAWRGQRRLVRHVDDSQLSFGIALSDKHSSHAGTTFASFNHTLVGVHQGEMWAHPSRALHKARAVGDGETRYVLVGFVHVGWWPTFWRLWGFAATTLREWKSTSSHKGRPSRSLVYASRRISRIKLFRRHLKSSARLVVSQSGMYGYTFLATLIFWNTVALLLAISLALSFLRTAQ